MPVVLASGRDQYCLLVTAINVALRQPLRVFRKSRKVPCSGSLTFRSCNCQRRYVTISALEAQRATPDSISTRVLMARIRLFTSWFKPCINVRWWRIDTTWRDGRGRRTTSKQYYWQKERGECFHFFRFSGCMKLTCNKPGY